MKIRIKERSLFARLAARQLNCNTVAAVFGRTIHLWNVDRDVFLKSTAWVVHEVEHVRQFQRYGWISFSIQYAWQHLRHGYEKNRFEQEARLAEAEGRLAEGIEFF